MRKASRMVIAILMIVVALLSFLAGNYVAGQKNEQARTERCKTLILFAIEKAENGDLSDQGVMRGLISNVYAAYQFCDDSKSANQLHSLWNSLIFEIDEHSETEKESVLLELNEILRAVNASN